MSWRALAGPSGVRARHFDGRWAKWHRPCWAWFAEMEVGFIRERQRAGIEAATARGIYKGRPVSLDHARIIELHRQGTGATAIAREMQCSRGAVYKVLGMAKPVRPSRKGSRGW